MAEEHEVHHHEGNSMGFIMGIILLVVALFLFVYYLLPGIRGGGTTFNIPSTPSVNVNPQ